ncbi:MAG: hypothetical protein VX278_09950 [Myxococcota bacterium]|nr:hypothetical protein [Myxococcota bacterium]
MSLLFILACAAKKVDISPAPVETSVKPPVREVSPKEKSTPPATLDPNARSLRVSFESEQRPVRVDLVCGKNSYRATLRGRVAFFPSVSGTSCLLRAKPMGTTTQIDVQDELICSLQSGGLTMICR